MANANNADNNRPREPDYLIELQRNDPANTSVFISLHPEDEPHANAVARALDRNEFVDEIYLVLNIHTRPRLWRALCQVLAEREKNDNVILIDNTPDIILAAGHNRQTVVDVSAPFFRAMQQNSHVHKVSLSVSLSGDVLGAFLDATATSLVALNFHSFEIDETDIPAVARALKRHSALKVLYMSCCATTLQLLGECVKIKDFFLECLSFRMNDDSLDQTVLPQVLQTASKLKLQHIFFRRVQSQAAFREITNAIPTFQMNNLDIAGDVTGWNVAETKQRFFAALKRNFCLRKVRCDSEVTEFITEIDERKVDFYMNRNVKLAEWVVNPSLVPKNLWPHALKLAVEAGYESLYRSLHAVAPEAGSSKRSRKRKRPVYYDPSSEIGNKKNAKKKVA